MKTYNSLGPTAPAWRKIVPPVGSQPRQRTAKTKRRAHSETMHATQYWISATRHSSPRAERSSAVQLYQRGNRQGAHRRARPVHKGHHNEEAPHPKMVPQPAVQQRLQKVHTEPPVLLLRGSRCTRPPQQVSDSRWRAQRSSEPRRGGRARTSRARAGAAQGMQWRVPSGPHSPRRAATAH